MSQSLNNCFLSHPNPRSCGISDKDSPTSAITLRASRDQRPPHSNESPPLSVSVSGKRDFAGKRQRRRKVPSYSTDRQLRQSAHTKTRQFGAICTTRGNLCLHLTAWWGREDSNLRPNDYQLLASEAPEPSGFA
jgi:hypothetical protein